MTTATAPHRHGADPGPTLPGFAHIMRLRDPRSGKVTAKILPGEYYVTVADEQLTTVLGSCVTACIWDAEAGVGGMNHFTLPTAGHLPGVTSAVVDDAARYGVYAMEFLINTVLRHGGARDRLLAKLVGGGNVVAGMTSIGAENVAFAHDYLAEEGIPVVGEHIGGTMARKVVFEPATGLARVRDVRARTQTIARRERLYADTLSPALAPGGIELF